MSEVFKSPRREALRPPREKRLRAELTPRDLAARLGRSQPFISDVEKGQYRVTVVEFLEIAGIGSDRLGLSGGWRSGEDGAERRGI